MHALDVFLLLRHFRVDNKKDGDHLLLVCSMYTIIVSVERAILRP